MRNVTKWLIVALVALIPTLSFATLRVFTTSDCIVGREIQTTKGW